MKRSWLLMGLMLFAATAQANDWWDSLWRNADQRGEQLLQMGKAAAAAQLFKDPRRKAYAESQAGNYARAAHDLAPFNDSNDNYNRGNALARAGELQDALKAYDEALAQDPNNRDAKHNRDLVARALRQKKPQQTASGNGGKSSKQMNGNDKQAGKQGRQGNASQNSASSGKDQGRQQANNAQKGNRQSGEQQANSQQQGKAGQAKQQHSAQATNRNQPKPGQHEQQPQQAGSAGRMAEAKGQQNQQGKSQSMNDAAQAKLDAEAAMGKPPAGSPAAESDMPMSEKQLAQEQWLRQIPDDPGGLLRRKFLIEHMIRQRGGQP
jgi:Ca-activated chloride channel family protein